MVALVCDMQLAVCSISPSEVGFLSSAVSPSAGWFHFNAGRWAATQRLVQNCELTSDGGMQASTTLFVDSGEV
jgi:hypothetical protein